MTSELQNYLEIFFKDLHSHPEISYQEYRTTKKIKESLIQHGIEIVDLALHTGLVAIIHGKKPGPIIALRADIDALPIKEETELPWKSKNDNAMHACGHDFHTTVLVGAAILLQNQKNNISGTIKLIFQPAEESSQGAIDIIKTGILHDVEVIHGVHVTGEFPLGVVAVKSGSMTAAVDKFLIRIKGQGAHAAKPHLSHDPVIVIGALIQNIQTIISRNTNPFNPSVLSITHIKAGNTWNVIPETGILEGTIRTLDKENRTLLKKRFYSIIKSITQMYDVEYEIDWTVGPPSTNNSQEWTETITELALKEGFSVEKPNDNMGGEDFAFYQESIPGVYWQIGTGLTYPNHHPKFQVDIQNLDKTALLYSQLAIATLERLRSKYDSA